jgi:hypothetical protein
MIRMTIVIQYYCIKNINLVVQKITGTVDVAYKINFGTSTKWVLQSIKSY